MGTLRQPTFTPSGSLYQFFTEDDRSKMRTFKEYIRELTVSPWYQQKGVFNPFYTLDTTVETDVKSLLNMTDVKFQNVENGTGELLKDFGGKFIFQVTADKYIKVKKSQIKSHFGMKQRKDSTASSNVNEYLTVYFLKHGGFTDAESWMADVAKKTGGTGIYYGEGHQVSYEELIELLDKDETAIRDINIGYQNSIAVQGDLGATQWSKLYWTPRQKPAGIGGKNPSDVILKMADGSFIGYSNKIAAGKDATPKFNTNIYAFYGKLVNQREQSKIGKLIDKAWNDAVTTVTGKNAQDALKKFNIKKEKFSESASGRKFALLAKEFEKDNLSFFSTDMYYPFRNNCITSFSDHLLKQKNLSYFLQTIGYYTFDEPDSTPCPYKLLVGSERGSTLKEVSSNEGYKQILFSKSTDLTNITKEYTGTSQSFKISFRVGVSSVTIPITMRTRATGGWKGKSLYITTSGLKIR
jgi:hypothetical protein